MTDEILKQVLSEDEYRRFEQMKQFCEDEFKLRQLAEIPISAMQLFFSDFERLAGEVARLQPAALLRADKEGASKLRARIRELENQLFLEQARRKADRSVIENNRIKERPKND